MLLQNIFINRKEELKAIPRGLNMGQSFVLIAPRRYGKTTLIKKITQSMSNNNSVVFIDVMKYSYSLTALAEAIIDGCLAHIGMAGKFRSWVSNLNIKLDIKVKIQELELEAIIDKLSHRDEFSAFAEALELPERMAIKSGKRWVLVFDEIGELQNMDPQIIKTMRSVVQHHKHVSYIFAGSQESVMNNIFISNKGAFYRFGQIYPIKELKTHDVMEFFNDNLSNVNQSVIDYVVANFKGHPYYTTNIFYRITAAAQDSPDTEFGLSNLRDVLNDLITSESHYLEDQVQKLGKGKHNLPILKATVEGNPYQITLSKQGVYPVLNKLVRDGYVRKRESGYELTDPLLNLYLQDSLS